MPLSAAGDLSAKPQAVVFDWDNTLVDTWPIIHAALEATFTAMGQVPWTFDETRQRVAKSLRDSFPDLFGDRWEDAATVFYDTFGSLHLERLTPLDQAENLLREIAGAGVPCSIVSNKNGRFLRDEVKHLGWGDLIHASIGATDAARDKPDPAPMHMALDGTGLTPSRQIWYVGDSPIDMQFAAATGCRGILVHSTEVLPETRSNSDLILADLSELISLFNELPTGAR